MSFTSLEENVIKAIGLKGHSRTKELKEDETLHVFSFTEIYNAIKELEGKGVLSKGIVRLGGSRKYNYTVFEFTEEGEKEAERLLNQAPVLSQKQQLANQHKNMETGYIFIDCQLLLQEKGILIDQVNAGYSLTINEKTYPLFIDTLTDGRKHYTRSDYQTKFDAMYEQSSTFYYLSPAYIHSSFLILDEIEAWMKERILNQQEQKPFQFYSSYTGRIFEEKGEQWDSLIELWTNGITRFGKFPSI